MPADPQVTVMGPSSAEAQLAMRSYFGELDQRFPAGFDTAAATAAALDSFTPPQGLFLVATDGTAVVACGGIQWVDEHRGELKRMWVDPTARGRGLGRLMLARLEHEVRCSGRSVVVLDTNAVLTEAIAMYRRAGYVEIDRYNDNPDADLWFEKHLT